MADSQFDPLAGLMKPYAIDPIDLAKKAQVTTKKELDTKPVPSSVSAPTPEVDYGSIADQLIKNQQAGIYDRDSVIKNLQTIGANPANAGALKDIASGKMKLDYGSVQNNVAGNDSVVRAPTAEESKNESMRSSVDMGIKDYITRVTGKEANFETVQRALGGIPYKNSFQYEQDARVAINDALRKWQGFTMTDELMGSANKYLKNSQPIQDYTKEFTDTGLNQFEKGFKSAEVLSSYAPPSSEDVSTGTLPYALGQVAGFITDMAPIAKGFQVLKIAPAIAGIGEGVSALTKMRTAGLITQSVLENGLQMAVQGQLVNPESYGGNGSVAQRTEKFGSDFIMGGIFALGGMGARRLVGISDLARPTTVAERLGISGLMSGFGYAVTKAQGGSDEDARHSALLFGLMEIAGGFHGTIGTKEARALDAKARVEGLYNTGDLGDIATRATAELKDLMGWDQDTLKSAMLRYQDIRQYALNSKDGIVPRFFDTPSGRDLFDMYTKTKDLSKQEMEKAYSLMGSAMKEAKQGMFERRPMQAFQTDMETTKLSPNSFFRSTEFKDFYQKGTDVPKAKLDGDIVVDANGAIVSGFQKAKEAIDSKLRTVDVSAPVKSQWAVRTNEKQISTNESKASQPVADPSSLPEFEGYSDVTTRVLDKLQWKKVVSRDFIENSLREQGIRDQEREITQEVLKEYGDRKSIPVKEFAEKVQERLMPLEIEEVRDHNVTWDEYQLDDNTTPGYKDDYVELVHKAPIVTDMVHHHNFEADTSRYFGHSRIQVNTIEGKRIAVVNEVQSDLMQSEKYKGILSTVKKAERAISDNESNISGLEKKIADSNEKIQSLSEDIKKWEELGMEEKYVDVTRSALETVKSQLETYTERKRQMEDSREQLQKQLEDAKVYDKEISDSPGYKQIESYKNTWGERMIREVTKWAKDEGLDGIMFPDGKTVAFVERWNGGDAQTVPDNLWVWEEFEMYGEDYVIVKKYDYDNMVQAVRKENIEREFYFSEDDFKNDEEQRVREDLKYEMENYDDELKDEFGKNYQKKYDDGKLDEDTLVEFILEKKFPDGFWDIQGYMDEMYGEGMTLYDEGEWKLFIFKSRDPEETFETGAWEKSADLERSLEDLSSEWSDDQKGVSYFYEKIVPKILQKQRKDMYKWTDDNTGLEYYRVDFNEQDKPGQPIYAYQKLLKSEKNATITQEKANEILAKYFEPGEINVNFVDFITTPEGFKALGRYRNATIDFVKNPDATTPEHETVHAYFDMFTDKARQAEILMEIKQKNAIEDNIQAEEILADGFVDYVRGKNRETLSEKVSGFFQDVWEALKGMFGRPNKINAFYDDILARKREYLADKFEVVSKYSSEAVKDPLVEISKEVLRPGQDPIGFSYDTGITARERFNIPALTEIGKGSDRTVFDLGANKVLKVSQSSRGLSQNAQADFYLAEEGILPMIYERGTNYVVMEKVKTYKEATPEEKKIIRDFVAKVEKAWNEYIRAMIQPFGRDSNRIYQLEDKLREVLDEEGWGELANYDLAKFGWGDIANRNMGIKDGKPVLLDEGTVNLREYSNKSPTGVKESISSDPDFRKAYYDSRRAKSEYGDNDKYTRFKSSELEVQKLKQELQAQKDKANQLTPFDDPEQFSRAYEEIDRIEKDILDRIDQEQYMKAQKDSAKEHINQYLDYLMESGFAEYGNQSGLDKGNMTKIGLLPLLRQSPEGKALIDFATIRGETIGKLVDGMQKNRDSANMDYFADYLMRENDDIYSLIQRGKDYPWTSPKKSRAKNMSNEQKALETLKGIKSAKEQEKKMEKLSAKEQKASEEKQKMLDSMLAQAKASDRMLDQATKEDPTLLKIYQEGYDKASEDLNKSTTEKFVSGLNGGRSAVGDFLAPVWKAGRTMLTPISSRLRNIAPEAYHALKRMEYKTGKAVADDMHNIEGFMEGLRKMRQDDYKVFNLALLNADSAKVDEIATKYGLKEDLHKARAVFDNIYAEAKEVGIDVQYLDNYFPRVIRNAEKLMSKLEGREDWNDFYQALKEEAKKQKVTIDELSMADKAKILNNMLRGYGNQINLSAPGNLTKHRAIDYITPDLAEMYYEPIDAMLRYIQSTRENIEARRFFGKADSIKDSIGTFTAKLVDERKINQTQAKELQKILKTYFGRTEAWWDVLNHFRNLTYLMTIANPKSALTNLEDIALTLSDGGVWNAILAVAKRGEIGGVNLKDLGLHELQGELTDKNGTALLLETLFKYSGFKYLDTRMKEAYSEAYYGRLMDMAKDPNKAEDLRYELVKYFPREEVDQIVSDLQGHKLTDLVYEAMYRKLSAVQPVSMGEVPELYLQHSGFKLFYALKTFQLKRWDYYRNEAFRGMSDPNQVVSASRRLAMMAVYMFLTGYTVDTIKNFMFGRTTSPTIAEDQIWKMLGITKYQIYGARDKWPIETLATSYLTPALFTMTTDIFSMYHTKDKKGNDMVMGWNGDKYIPYVWPFVSWWFGSSKARQDVRDKNAREKEMRARLSGNKLREALKKRKSN